jgi:hypothetical protein
VTPDGTSIPLVSAIASDARRDLRVDFVRGLALLVIFSDHVIGNSIRDFMPISLGFSDMAEVFIFLSGYLNGIRPPPADVSDGTRRQFAKTLSRCAGLYGAILLMNLMAVVLLAVASRFGINNVSFPDLALPPSHDEVGLWNILTLQRLLFNSSVLALYLMLIWIVPFVGRLLRSQPLPTVAASGAVYTAVQIWPQSFTLPAPWAEAVFFNPLAWQLPFVLGMAWGAGGARCKVFIPRGWLAVLAAACCVEVAFLVKCGWWNPHLEWGIDKPTLGPVRLLHFYCILILGRALFRGNCDFLRNTLFHPVLVCARHPLATYVAGGLLATLGTMLLAKYGTGLEWTIGINVGGWAGSVLAAYAATMTRDLAGRRLAGLSNSAGNLFYAWLPPLAALRDRDS